MTDDGERRTDDGERRKEERGKRKEKIGNGRGGLKVLLVHNFYGTSAPSGENTAYVAERELLKKYGHEIIEFTRHSDDIRNRGFSGTLIGAFSTPWNPHSMRQIHRVLEREKPDIMHAHNTFPLISPSVFRAARGLGTATVLTLHNYRIFCAAGIPMRKSAPCIECIERDSVLPALKYGCYRNSRWATIPLAAMISLYKMLGTWKRDVDAFIALSEFQKKKVTDGGLPQEKVHVKPHFYPNPPAPLPWKAREAKIVFVGRLGWEKGVHILVDAWQRWGHSAPVLEIIGDGPQRADLEKMVDEATLNRKICFFGQLPFSQTQAEMAKARLLVLPSLCFEGFPMVIREAFALSVPVAGSRIGSLPEIITDNKTGRLFSPGDPADLLRVVKGLWEDPENLAGMAKRARVAFEKKYTGSVNHDALMEIYGHAIRERDKNRRNRK